MIDVEIAAPLDVMAWQCRPHECVGLDLLGMRARATAAAHAGQVEIFLRAGEPQLMAGISAIYPHGGVGELWMFGTPALELRWQIMDMRQLVKLVRARIARRFGAMKLHRLQTVVRTESRRDLAFARAMGFVRECDVAKLGPDAETLTLMRWEPITWPD